MTRWADGVIRSFRQASRHLHRSRGFTGMAVLTFALCIGANTAILSVIDQVLLRPLPYPDSERLVSVATAWRGGNEEGIQTSQEGHVYRVIRERARLLESAAIGLPGDVNFSAGGKPEVVRQQRVSAGFFHVLGVSPQLGREASVEEDRAGGPSVVVLSHALWQRAFRADPAPIGRAVTLGGEPAVVIGVMPPGFRTNAPADLWTPLRSAEAEEGQSSVYEVVARLKPGVTLAAAEAQIETLSNTALLGATQAGFDFRLHLLPLRRGWNLARRTPSLLLWAAGSAILLIGCGNIACLLLARSAGRAKEVATRVALGSSRSAVIQQLLVETLLLAGGGCAAGLAMGWAGVRGLRLLAAGDLDVAGAHLDLRILFEAAGLSLMSCLLSGVIPAFRTSDVDLRSAMLPRGCYGVRGGESSWARRLLVAGEVAVEMNLLIAAGLLVQSLVTLSELRPGFDGANVLTAQLSLRDARYRTGRHVTRLTDAGLSRIRELQGVEAAAVALALPYEHWPYMSFSRSVDDHPSAHYEVRNLVLNYVTPDFFRTLRIPVVRGRPIDGGDRADTAPVVVVSQAFVGKYMPGEGAIGARISIGGKAYDIVGVVGDVQEQRGWSGESRLSSLAALPAAYIPLAQMTDALLQNIHRWFSPSLIVRTAAPPSAVLPRIQRAVEAIDPQLPMISARTMAEVRSGSLRGQRVLATLLVLLAGLALVLAALGIYSLIANAVESRTHELGIRMALGATVSQAMASVAAPDILLALIGIAAGSLLSQLAVPLLRHVLWGIGTMDRITFTAALLLLLGTAAAASYLPARRLVRLDPALTLRHE